MADNNNQNNRNWGGAPQKSSTGSSPGNPRWGGAPQKSDTGSQPEKPVWGGAPQKSNTGVGVADEERFADVPEYSRYEIDGVVYQKIRVVSSNSGEAKILEVENGRHHFALKLYKPCEHPNHEVLERVMKLRGNGLLVDIYGHGVWTDKTTGIKHDYEIMEYCSGGSLATLDLLGDDDKLEEIAVRMASALDFAHSQGILHRDVKPANFLFTDETQSQFVLTDWGLAKMLDSQGRTVTDSGRTKIYAAPEMYTYIPGKPTYVDTKADFFSMGMTLLALWMGEGKLIADETKLVKDKQYGRLPYPAPNSISRHLLSLIKALTRNNPDERAGFEEIVKWAKGEIIFNDDASDDSLPEFKVVFDADKKLIAHSPEELGVLMWENRDLGKKFLYSDESMVYQWLMDTDRISMAIDIDDIVEIYPKDRDAGLFCACLILNPKTVYEGLSGNLLNTTADIAGELLQNVAAYKKALYNKKEHPLWAYLSSKGLGKEIQEFRRLIRKDGESGIKSVAYTLCPEFPYAFEGKGARKNSVVRIESLDDLARALVADEIFDLEKILDNDFLLWAAHRNAVLAGKAKEMIDGGFRSLVAVPESRSAREEIDDFIKETFISYVLLPDVGLDYMPVAESKLVTPEQLTLLIQPKAYIDEGSLVVRIDRVEKRIQAYLAARGKFRSQLSWILYCFDFSSPDFNKKFVPYDDVVARFKTAAGFNGAPLPLQVNDMVLKEIDDVEREDLSKLPAHIQDLIAKWLSLFFHEEINADYSKESYMKRAERYFEFIYANLPGSSYAKSAKPKVDAIGKAEKDYLRARRKVKGVRWFAALFCLLPLLLVIIAGVYILITQGASELGSLMHTIGTWAGLIIGVIAGGAAFVESENLIVGGIVGAICFAVVKFCLVFITPAVPWIILGFFFIQLLLNAHAVFTSGFGSVARQYSDLTMSEGVLRAEMGKAFNCRSKLLPANLPEDYPEVIYRRDAKTLNGTFGSFVKKIIWLFIVAMGACAFCIWIYRMDPDKIDHHSVSPGVELLEGSFSGNVKGTPLDVEFSKKDEVMSANMVIKYRSGTTTQTMKSNGDDLLSFPIVMAKVDNEAITLKIDTAYIEAGTTVATGIYLNSKGNSQPVNITKK